MRMKERRNLSRRLWAGPSASLGATWFRRKREVAVETIGRRLPSLSGDRAVRTVRWQTGNDEQRKLQTPTRNRSRCLSRPKPRETGLPAPGNRSRDIFRIRLEIAGVAQWLEHAVDNRAMQVQFLTLAPDWKTEHAFTTRISRNNDRRCCGCRGGA